MKNKILLTILLYLPFVVYFSTKTLAQEFSQEIGPSAVHVAASKYIDFKSGYWAPKGTVISATIKTSSFNCIDDENLVGNTNNSNEVDINSQKIENVDNDFDWKDRNDNIQNKGFENTQMIVYPNPFKDKLFIDFNLDSYGPLQINLFNVQGKLVKTIINSDSIGIGHQSYAVNLENLNHGMYFIQIQAGDLIESKKIIK